MIVDPAALWAAPPQMPEVHPDFPEDAQVCVHGHEARAGAKFCPECGTPFAAPVVDWLCRNGHPAEARARFCSECGDARPDLRAPVAGAGAAVEALARPRPYEELSPAERAERDRQHIEAVSLGRRDPGVVYEPPRTKDTELIHFLEDGLSFAGTVWFRGQEIELDVGSLRWQQAQAWINMTDFEQMERWGKVYFRHGPWPGKRYVDAIKEGGFQRLGSLREGGEEVAGPDINALLQAEARERSRQRGVPRPVAR